MSFYNKSIKCKNCGKKNHVANNCRDPITSCGVICFRFNDECMKEIFNKKIANLNEKNINIFQFNSKFNKNLNKINQYLDKIEFLMIQRKHSYAFIEIVYGKFAKEDESKIINLVRGISYEECDIILNTNYEDIVKNIFNDIGYKNSTYYSINKERYSIIQGIIQEEKPDLKYTGLEWGFPKGRRKLNENNIDCAIREFCEETSYSPGQMDIIKDITPVREIFKGTNNMLYRYIYYISHLKDNEHKPFIDLFNTEVSAIQWMALNDTRKCLRDYHGEKKKIVIELYKFLINIIES